MRPPSARTEQSERGPSSSRTRAHAHVLAPARTQARVPRARAHARLVSAGHPPCRQKSPTLPRPRPCRAALEEGTAELITELLQRGRSPEEDIGTPLEEAMRLLERDFGAGPHGGAQAVTA